MEKRIEGLPCINRRNLEDEHWSMHTSMHRAAGGWRNGCFTERSRTEWNDFWLKLEQNRAGQVSMRKPTRLFTSIIR